MTNAEPTPPPRTPQGPPGSDDGDGISLSPLYPEVTPAPQPPDSSGGMPRSTLDGIHGTRGDEPARWSPSHPGELPPYWTKDYVQDQGDPGLWWPDNRPSPPGTVKPAAYDPAKDSSKPDDSAQGNKLDVNPADLTNAAGEYADLQRQAAAIGPQALEEVNRIIATHGAMGYPVAVGVVAGLARKQARMDAQIAQFGVYSERFTEHRAAYEGQDSAGAAGYQQVQFSV